ncbi:Protocadherin-15 [Oopsacas minuta]|uniref:Protocadherin-15 n=1 Tax=Oopsacas minuta TaxID=111878 RepID=A0AAV7KA26_9METZ|nr:Protocadherin-15 [Oopsacas minuta]
MITNFSLAIQKVIQVNMFWQLFLESRGRRGILATDDEFDNITYEKVDLTDSPEITLDSISGVLEVAILLDREMTNSYSFDIRANDGINRGIQFLPIVTVQIVVLDVNDNMPVFVNPPYEFTIEEGVSDGHQVNPSYERISVTDKDIGNNQPSEFSIISGHDDRFMIDQNGNIITTLDDSAGVEKIIDYETKQVFDLVVRATNIEDGPAGSVFSEVNVTILILNINDEDPIFSASSVNQIISIPEAMSGVINTLQAMDTDDVLSIPTTFTYSIVYGNNLINGLHSFAIDPTSGSEAKLTKNISYT